MRATHLVCLEVLEEVSLNTMEYQYIYVLKNSVLAWVYIFKIALLFIMICGCVLQVEKLDLITASMGHALATEGGFCTGSARVIDHQVWNLLVD